MNESTINAFLESAPVRGSGPKIISSVHDTSKITVAGSDVDAAIRRLSGGSRGWDASEYGISEVQARAQFEQANTSEAREAVMVDLRRRALRRAGLDVTSGKVAVMVAGEPAWHGLGVNVEDAVNAREARELASLGWSVSKKALAWMDDSGVYHESNDAFGIVRDDTMSYLGTVGSRYKPIQNDEGFDFLDDVIGEFGAKYRTAGAVHSGKRVWMLIDLPEQAFKVGGKDEVRAYALFTNSHDGLSAARVLATSERVVCANTLRVALGAGKEGLSLRHTGSIKDKIASARQALGLTVRAYGEFQENANTLAATKIADPINYFDGILDQVCEVSAAECRNGVDMLVAYAGLTGDAAEARRKVLTKQIKDRENMRAELMERYESERCGINGMRGTAWAGLNAVTEFSDHSKLIRYKGSEEARASRRFESVLTGDGDEMKQIAYQSAMALSM